ncbi:MAG: VOC family protein [Dermatophilaceae bacterium]
MSSKQQINTCLWYDRNGLVAAELYCHLIPGSKITRVSYAAKGVPNTAEGDPLEVEFHLADQRFVALNGGPHFPHTAAASIQVYVDSQEELDRIWDGLLADGGHEVRCGWLTDRFGLSWQVIPTRFVELCSTGDPLTKDRVFAQMLKMTKLDIAPLEVAAAGDPVSTA